MVENNACPKTQMHRSSKVPSTKANSGGADTNYGQVVDLCQPYASSFLSYLLASRFPESVVSLLGNRAPTRNCSVSTQAYSRDDRRCAGCKRFKKGVVCGPWRASQTSPACYVGAVGKRQASNSTGRPTGCGAAACMTDRIIFLQHGRTWTQRREDGRNPGTKDGQDEYSSPRRRRIPHSPRPCVRGLVHDGKGETGRGGQDEHKELV